MFTNNSIAQTGRLLRLLNPGVQDSHSFHPAGRVLLAPIDRTATMQTVLSQW